MSTPSPDTSSPNPSNTSPSYLLGVLLRRYRRVLTNPGLAVFRDEKTNASEQLVWFQVLILAFFTALTLVFSQGRFSLGTPIYYSLSAIFTIGGFFLSEYISYRTARVLGGSGTFFQQSYLTLLIYIPVAVLSFVLARIPLFGDRLTWLLDLYSLVLYVIMMRAVHNLSIKRALLATLTPFLVVIVLIGVLFFIGIVCSRVL